MKKLLTLITLIAVQANSFALNYGHVQNKADRDIWIAGQDAQCKTCAKPVPGLTTEVKIPFFRLGKNDKLRFETGDRIKIRYYTDAAKDPVKGTIAFNAGSELITIKSIAKDGGLVLEGGNFSKK